LFQDVYVGPQTLKMNEYSHFNLMTLIFLDLLNCVLQWHFIWNISKQYKQPETHLARKKITQLGYDNYIYSFLKFGDQTLSIFKIGMNSNFKSTFKNYKQI